MRDELLALLEDGPHPTDELASWLSADAGAIALELAWMKDAGLVRRINTTGERCWCLAGYIVPPRAKPHHSVSTGRKSRLVPSPAPSATTSSSGRPIRIINGECFEVVNDCSGPVTEEWPDGSATESVFSGRGFKVVF